MIGSECHADHISLTKFQDLVGRLSQTDYKVTNGVLEVAHSIFVRWRPLFRSNELFEEINNVLAVFGEPYVKMLTVRLPGMRLHFSALLITVCYRSPMLKLKRTRTTLSP